VGLGPDTEAIHAFCLTILITLIVVPANTIFGIACAIVIVRHRAPGKGILNAVADLPLALAIVVVLAFLLLFGTRWLHDVPFDVSRYRRWCS
jgi:sulfate transport system permease protein